MRKIKNNIIILIAAIVILPALFINLGTQPLIDDEGIRAVVAFEMDHNKDYVTPTLAEQLYFKKPPLYNWLVILSMRLTNSFSEFTLRLPTVVFLMLFAFVVFYVVKKKYSTKHAFLVALMFVTTARMLFYESTVGLIDTSYSLLIFINFILIYYYFRKERFLHLFVFSYALIAVTFLMKGLTSVAFQAMTLIPYFVVERRFKKLFAWQHFLGIFVFLIIAGAYYLAYYLKNPEAIETLLRTILFESTDKSAIGSGTNELLLHILKFPLDVIYHFVPWTLLVIFLFRKGVAKTIRQNPFLRFSCVIFVANLIVYWLSPTTYPRYLMALIPILLILLVHFFIHEYEERTLLYRIFEKVLMGAAIIVTLAVWVIPFIDFFEGISLIYLKVSAIFGALALTLFAFLKFPNKRIELFLIFMLVIRIGYNFFVIPKRGDETTWHGKCRADAIEVGKFTKGEELFLKTGVNYKSYYYLEREREAPITYKNQIETNKFYLIHDPENKFKNGTKYKTMRISYNKHVIDLVKFE